MKKIIASGLLAVCLIAVSKQEASAWVNSKFGIGLNWDFQSGGNSFLWGLWRNGQPPGPEAFGAQRGFGAPMMAPGINPYGPGIAPSMAPSVAPSVAPIPYAPTGPTGMFQPGFAPDYAGMTPANPFQFANYARPMQYQYNYNPYQYNMYQYTPFQYYPNR